MDLTLHGLWVDAGSGPGSRGGRIIGRTASGKLIYDRKHQSYANFTAEDHEEARETHQLLVGLYSSTPRRIRDRKNTVDRHRALAAYHAAQTKNSGE